jgi:hypothetical protein
MVDSLSFEELAAEFEADARLDADFFGFDPLGIPDSQLRFACRQRWSGDRGDGNCPLDTAAAIHGIWDVA